jgi:hypothetical protein
LAKTNAFFKQTDPGLRAGGFLRLHRNKKLGEDMDKNSIIQTGIDLNCRQLANDLADRTPSKS